MTLHLIGPNMITYAKLCEESRGGADVRVPRHWRCDSASLAMLQLWHVTEGLSHLLDPPAICGRHRLDAGGMIHADEAEVTLTTPEGPIVLVARDVAFYLQALTNRAARFDATYCFVPSVPLTIVLSAATADALLSDIKERLAEIEAMATAAWERQQQDLQRLNQDRVRVLSLRQPTVPLYPPAPA